MTQEEAIKILKDFHDESALFSERTALETLYPEFKESEDERTRKEIIAWLKNSEGQTLPIDRYNAALAWLEKQGEQKPQRMISAEAKEVLYDKPAWSEEDEDKLTSCIAAIIACHQWDSMIEWLKSLKERVHPKQEWSEEDEKNFARVDYACLKVYGGDSYSSDWLRKFLGIHKKWKPSEEQLEALKNAIHIKPFKNPSDSILWGLYEQLNKLKS